MKKMMKKLATAAFTFITAFSLSIPTLAEEDASSQLPTEENPMVIDKEAGTISIYAYVNGKYLETSTRHAVVFDDGNFGGKSVFGTTANQNEFYEALLEIGAEPGDNMTAENAEETHVEGDLMDIKVSWEGAEKEYDLSETIIDSNGNDFEFHFGGNKGRAHDKHTGCITCLDSCPVGLISNATYTYGAVEKRGEVEFSGNSEILPEEGTPVIITYSIHKDKETIENKVSNKKVDKKMDQETE
ncbi:YdjY domain-containing protein [Facklamia sp. 7083-14-GEN3]|uniref:YdjY domain-containing protein n=1 Tax=Facklamia sp. 7083-14-GEN3 TaxID=2973478 RepID=UPI00215BCCBF|nr:YdjY domain-containing protein [Facklamia sp. 7083-14-GEN3]MCR8968577.1 YdjY domain-containing protein [Facklamia sp. 7083-14-GEN3]